MINRHTFKKGHHIGRPKGSKDKQYLNLRYWFERLNAEYSQLKPEKRADISLKCLLALVAKLPSIPNDPANAVKNSKETMDLIKSLEVEAGVETIAKTSETDDIPKSGLSEEAKAVIEQPSKIDIIPTPDNTQL